MKRCSQRGIIVRGGHALGMPTYLRVTVGSREQNEKFIAALGTSFATSSGGRDRQMTRVTIYGVGLIGGSLALCFKDRPGYTVIGHSSECRFSA